MISPPEAGKVKPGGRTPGPDTAVTDVSSLRAAVSTDRASVMARLPVLTVVMVFPRAGRALATAPVGGPAATGLGMVTAVGTAPVTAMAVVAVTVPVAAMAVVAVTVPVATMDVVAVTVTVTAPPRAAGTAIRTATVRPHRSPCICARSSRRS